MPDSWYYALTLDMWLFICICSSPTTSTYAGLPEQKALYICINPRDLALQSCSLFFNPPPTAGIIHCPLCQQRSVFGSFFHYFVTVLRESLRTQHVSAQAITVMHVCNGIFALHGPAARNAAPRLPPSGKSPAQQLPDPNLQLVFIQQFLLERFSIGK